MIELDNSMTYFWLSIVVIFTTPFLLFTFVYVYRTIQERKEKREKEKEFWRDVNER